MLRQEVTKMKYNLTKASQKLKNCEEQKNVITKQFEIQKGEAVQLEKGGWWWVVVVGGGGGGWMVVVVMVVGGWWWW